MLRYLAKRILLFVPTLLVISLLAFGLSRLAPGDMVVNYLITNPFETSISSQAGLFNAEKTYRQAAQTLNLDKPAFYFSISSKAYPDTLYNIVIKDRRETLKKLIAQFGNWTQIESYYNAVRSLDLKILAQPDSLGKALVPFKIPLRELYAAWQEPVIESRLGEMEAALRSDSLLTAALGSDFFDLKNKFQAVKSEATPGKLKIPAFHWHGLDNQYHCWVSNFVRGDFGVSVFDRRPASDKIKSALFWTLVLNLAGIFLAFLLAVPLGVWSAVKRGKMFDKITSLGLFMLPAFWIGTMLLVFFTTREYGMNIFPGPGLGNVPSAAPWWQKIWIAAPHLFLPIVCIAYPALAFISRQARGGMVNVLGQDFIRTARAKGLPEGAVIWRHGFRNALFPVITLIASVFPAAIAGSVTIEFIFNIPGMGWLTYNAILMKDWPVVFTILMLGSVLTVVGMLVADVLYALTDPRVRFKE
jgi:peptide/nickel transport system permease protein